ncbi:MAG: hypothetical protein D6687_05710 [Acidobacteria bacterium]|jgi:hypothetical protein|nr:MAG: hypothetical protein D6687_05710 [Acidobacteriota bacterium]GIU82707.1 MAG: hypothetical protein KatS3mg006_1771 [Pyrinomonadaceae bacterium]
MIASMLRKITMLKKIFAAIQIFCLSGILCSFCCDTAKAEQQSYHCPLAKFGNCEKSSDSKVAKSQGNSFGCCGLMPNLLDNPKNIEKNKKFLVLTYSELQTQTINWQPFFFQLQQTRIKRAQKLYLKNRVLLI